MTDPFNAAGLSTLIDDTAAAVVAPPLAQLRARRARRHRRRAALGLVAVVLAGGATGGLLTLRPGEPTSHATTPVVAPSPPLAYLFEWQSRLADGPDCGVPSNVPRFLASADFAFDGSVSAIRHGSADTSMVGAAEPDTVTFTVHEWFRGGTGDATVTLAFPRATPVSDRPDETTLNYGLGTRILVRGEIPPGGTFPDQVQIGEICGPSNYYDATAAAILRAYYAAHP
jgi:hypothetical protein